MLIFGCQIGGIIFLALRGLGTHIIQTEPGPTRPPIQWGMGALSAGLKLQGREADCSLLSSAEVKKGGAILPLPHLSSWHSA
jgi:hypothetical protein